MLAAAQGAQGADLIDVGGESTRPGSRPVEPEEQVRRTAPVIARLRKELDALGPMGQRVRIGIDTTRTEVGRAALEAGAWMLNDVSAGRDDAGMVELAARTGAGGSR